MMWSFMKITAVPWSVFFLLQLMLRHHWQGFASYWCELSEHYNIFFANRSVVVMNKKTFLLLTGSASSYNLAVFREKNNSIQSWAIDTHVESQDAGS